MLYGYLQMANGDSDAQFAPPGGAGKMKMDIGCPAPVARGQHINRKQEVMNNETIRMDARSGSSANHQHAGSARFCRSPQAQPQLRHQLHRRRDHFHHPGYHP